MADTAISPPGLLTALLLTSLGEGAHGFDIPPTLHQGAVVQMLETAAGCKSYPLSCLRALGAFGALIAAAAPAACFGEDEVVALAPVRPVRTTLRAPGAPDRVPGPLLKRSRARPRTTHWQSVRGRFPWSGEHQNNRDQ